VSPRIIEGSTIVIATCVYDDCAKTLQISLKHDVSCLCLRQLRSRKDYYSSVPVFLGAFSLLLAVRDNLFQMADILHVFVHLTLPFHDGPE
jgi:hypothetical protein